MKSSITMLFLAPQVVTSLEKLAEDQLFNSHIKNIKEGRFRREQKNPIYKSRLEYTKQLRYYIYNPAVMNIILSDNSLKKLFFRTFGYKGQLDFTIYPNAWLRDLPLLNFGEKVYLADNILLGTNQVSIDQAFITVGSIDIGARTVIDQKVSIGYKTTIKEDCAIGFSSAIGLKCKIGHNTVIGERITVGHGTQIGQNVKVNKFCLIGNMCIIDDHIEIPPNTTIPAFSQVTTNGIFNRRRCASNP